MKNNVCYCFSGIPAFMFFTLGPMGPKGLVITSTVCQSVRPVGGELNNIFVPLMIHDIGKRMPNFIVYTVKVLQVLLTDVRLCVYGTARSPSLPGATCFTFHTLDVCSSVRRQLLSKSLRLLEFLV